MQLLGHTIFIFSLQQHISEVCSVRNSGCGQVGILCGDEISLALYQGEYDHSCYAAIIKTMLSVVLHMLLLLPNIDVSAPLFTLVEYDSEIYILP